ncbi:hypothetical protein BDZ89DRAFT_1043582 [Hymenopellis radicata]|nr:hypothetical protein BDZ89DRAFT_1043582 [Hymenopellis radicata]
MHTDNHHIRQSRAFYSAVRAIRCERAKRRELPSAWPKVERQRSDPPPAPTTQQVLTTEPIVRLGNHFLTNHPFIFRTPPRVVAAPSPQALTAIEEALDAGPHDLSNPCHLVPDHVIRNALKALVLFRRHDRDGRAQLSCLQLGKFILSPGSMAH